MQPKWGGEMAKIVTTGRTDLEAYFSRSGVFSSDRLRHTPFLAFIEGEEEIQVRLVYRATDLLLLPDDTPVMGQWTGRWDSDFFQFTVGQYRKYRETGEVPPMDGRS